MPNLPKKISTRSLSSERKATKKVSTKTTQKTPIKISLALAGGGFLGAAYELGVLAALTESIEGLELNDLSSYIGVSAGAYVAAGLANGLTPHQMIRIFVEAEDSETPVGPDALLRPAYKEIVAAVLAAPKTLRKMAKHLNPKAPSAWRFVEEFGRGLPSGFIDAAPIAARIKEIFTLPGRSDDFSSFDGRLRILATDIDSGKSIEFGSEGFDDVPISTALSASSAVPGVFVPVKINGRRYLDGAINKTLHASVALAQGADLVICINPLVPFSSDELAADAAGVSSASLPTILAQTIRTAIRSRMAVGLEKYSVAFPKAHVMLFEPRQSDAAVFMTSILSLRNRRKICELAYLQTRSDLLSKKADIAPVLAKFGLKLRLKALSAEATPIVGVTPRQKPRKPKTLDAAAMQLRHAMDDLVRKVLIKKFN
jgi:NTE family protein